MLVEGKYDRTHVYRYAEAWARGRNPLFANFTGIGGDCTNFVSQCVYAGCCQMNPLPVFGWYYVDAAERTASWTGVEYFYNFMIANQGAGPYAEETDAAELAVGDVVQLGRSDGSFYHSLIVTGYEDGIYLVSSHSDDYFNRRLDAYRYSRVRFLHIAGVRLEIPDGRECFYDLLNGVRI